MKNIKLESAGNMRDLGGLKTADGRTVKQHRFLRGADISNLSPNDINILKNEYELKAVIDLRSPKEQVEKPDTKMDGVKQYLLSVDNGPAGGIPKDVDPNEFLKESQAQKLDNAPSLLSQYARFVTDPASIYQIKKIMHTVIDESQTDGAVLFHCFLGKDRTGLTAMLILSLLGVQKEDIIADYCFTPMLYRKAIKWYIKTLFKKKSFAAALEFYNRFKADPSYIKHLYETIDTHYGSVDNFLRNELEISDELKEEFRNNSLE